MDQPQPIKKPKNSLLIGLVALIIGLGGGIAIGYSINNAIIHKPNSKPESNPEKQAEQKEPASNQAREILTVARDQVKLRGEFDFNFDSGPHKSSVGDFYLSTAGFGMSNFSYKTDEEILKDKKSLNQFLADQGLKLANSKKNKEVEVQFYQNEKTFCSIQTSYQPSTDTTKSIHMNCGNIEYFKQAEQKLKPLMDGFFEKNKEDRTNKNLVVYFLPESIKNGATKDYKIASINVSNILDMGGYYQNLYQSPDGKWHLSFAGNGVPSCDQFDKEAEKAFFKNGKCVMDENGFVKMEEVIK